MIRTSPTKQNFSCSVTPVRVKGVLSRFAMVEILDTDTCQGVVLQTLVVVHVDSVTTTPHCEPLTPTGLWLSESRGKGSTAWVVCRRVP